MGKVLLGVSASPRKNGNCELMIKQIHAGMGAGWELRLARLSDFDIRPCQACYQCLFGKMRCPQEDGLIALLEEISLADAWIAAAPTYLLSANAALKKFLDRGLQFYAFVDRLWGKPAVAVAVAGIEGMEGSTKLNVESFAKLAFADLRGSDVFYGALPGETLLSPENRQNALRLAKSLLDASARIAPEGPVCPVCGGDTFRFQPGGRARCMLCSGSGTYGWKDGRLEIDIRTGDHPLFLTREDVIRHAEWLRGMKQQFLDRRKELKEAVKDYLAVGTIVERS